MFLAARGMCGLAEEVLASQKSCAVCSAAGQHEVRNTRLWSRRVVKELNLLPLPGFELQFLGRPAHSLVTMLTGLTQLTVNTLYVILVEGLEGKRAVDKKITGCKWKDHAECEAEVM